MSSCQKLVGAGLRGAGQVAIHGEPAPPAQGSVCLLGLLQWPLSTHVSGGLFKARGSALLPGGEVEQSQEPASWGGGVGACGPSSHSSPPAFPRRPLQREPGEVVGLPVSLQPAAPSAPQEPPPLLLTPLPWVTPWPCAGVGSEVKTGRARVKRSLGPTEPAGPAKPDQEVGPRSGQAGW